MASAPSSQCTESITRRFWATTTPCSTTFCEAGIPFSRLHDTGGSYGGSVFVDIDNIFRDRNADPQDPASYDFAFTDWLLEALCRQGAEPFYRLGATIENAHKIKAYHIFPPKDPAKWAEICDGIVRHYNEGWANGFRMNIRYWEIWNEPDNEPIPEDNPMWRGTMEEYFRLYETAANLLKRRHPELKIGGYGSCGFYALLNRFEQGAASSARIDYFIRFFQSFLAYISSAEHSAPLDFFSWHSYSDAKANEQYAAYAREQLDRYGFAQTESILDEWNAGTRWRGTLRDAALIAQMMCAMQKSPVDKLMYYDGQICRYGGLWDPVSRNPFPAYFAFRAFHVLYRLGQEARSGSTDESVSSCAAFRGQQFALLLANPGKEDAEAELRLDGVPEGTALEELSSAEAARPEHTAALQYHSGSKVLLPKDGVLLLRTPS